MKPRFEDIDVEQTLATVTFSAPSILQNTEKYSCADLKVDSFKYAIREVKQNEDGDQNHQSNFVDCKCDTSAAASPTPQPYEEMVNKLKHESKYKIKLRADYNTGDTVETEEVTFRTQQHTGNNCIENLGMCMSTYNLSKLLFYRETEFVPFLSVSCTLCYCSSSVCHLHPGSASTGLYLPSIQTQK